LAKLFSGIGGQSRDFHQFVRKSKSRKSHFKYMALRFYGRNKYCEAKNQEKPGEHRKQ
jgi:hypothetical protein